MKKQVSLTALAIATAMSATAAQAEDVKVSGKVFFDYASSTATGAADTTGGDISRTYLTASKKIDDTWSAKVTFDSAFDAKTSKSNNVFLKTAQLTGKFSDMVNVKLGMIGTPWIGYEDGLNGHRFIAKSYVDEQGLDSSADAGIGAFGKVGTLLNYDVVMVNGGGYGNTATSGKTDLNLRVGANLDQFMKGLTFDFGYRKGYNGKYVATASETENTLTQMLFTYGNKVDALSYRAGFNMINNKANDKLAGATTTLKGQELWVWARSGDFGGYFRYESTDNGKAGSATEKRTVISGDYYASKDVILSLVSDSTSDAGGVAGNKATKTGVFSQFKF